MFLKKYLRFFSLYTHYAQRNDGLIVTDIGFSLCDLPTAWKVNVCQEEKRSFLPSKTAVKCVNIDLITLGVFPTSLSTHKEDMSMS